MPRIAKCIIAALATATLFPGWNAKAAAVAQGTNAPADIACDLLNAIEITDAAGDASVGSPSWVDTLGLRFYQLGSDVYIRWDAATTELSNDDVLFETEQLFRMFFDTDHNSNTGQQYAGIGAELKITLGIYHGEAAIHDFDAMGEWLGEILVPVSFLGDGFAFKMPEKLIPSKNFLLLFESVGAWSDIGGPIQVQLDPDPPEVAIRTRSANVVLESGPRLMNLPERSAPLPLTTSLVIDDDETVLDPSQVSYTISHHAAHVISDPESIISIDENGIAHYNSEGFVSATASLADENCPILSEKWILATGRVYGEPASDDVIAVFPSDYVPDSSTFSFGEMMSGYPNYFYTVNLAYDMLSDLYHGFIPLNGDKQIFAPLVLEGHCGGGGNPLETAPCCYMNCGTGEPEYGVVIHEMGHNFHDAPGMSQFLWANQGRFGNERVHECIASFPFIYFFNEISQQGAQYGLGPGTYEWSVFNQWAQNDRTGWENLEEFELLLDTGKSSGFFDSRGQFETVGMFCVFFQAYMYGYKGYSTPYGHEMIRRFLNIFDKDELPDFQEDKVETYFAAAFSISVGSDEREQLRHWGFTIDDAFYDQIEPMLRSKVSVGISPPINAGHAGAWFNSQTSGQGQLIDIEPESRFMFLAWFTYTPADSDHPFEQHWYTAEGHYLGNEAELVVYETLGGKFDDPQAVSTEAVGSALLSFSDCGLGRMDYAIDTLGLSGSFPLQRVIPGSDSRCLQQQTVTTQSVDINGGMDGAWFDENTSGQGFLIDAHADPEDGNFIFVAWFTYGDDTASGQRWLTAQGDFAGSTAAIDVYETTGGSFNDPHAVTHDKVGTLTIDFQDCSNALLSYEITDETLSNSVAIHRLIPGAQALCEELAGAE